MCIATSISTVPHLTVRIQRRMRNIPPPKAAATRPINGVLEEVKKTIARIAVQPTQV